MAPTRAPAARRLLPPIVLTIAALTCLNLAIAYFVARSAGLRGLELPDAVVWLLLAVGVVAAVGAVWGWRRYVEQARAERHADGART